MLIKPVVLKGDYIRLEPLAEEHRSGLVLTGMEPELWRWTANIIDAAGDMDQYITGALRDKASQVSLPFATMLNAHDEIVGSTRFANIDASNRKVEIGWTWVASAWQRTYVNTEAKLLMLEHAFEVWNCIRVELKTDAKNEKSKAAIRRLGCVEEGTLRNHMITESGRFRDTVYFSIIESEWPAVKADLRTKLYDQR